MTDEELNKNKTPTQKAQDLVTVQQKTEKVGKKKQKSRRNYPETDERKMMRNEDVKRKERSGYERDGSW